MTSTSQAPLPPASALTLDTPADPASGLQRITWPTSERAALSGLRGEALGHYLNGPAILAPGARVGILCDTLHGDPEIDLDYHAALETACELIVALGYEPVVDRVHANVSPYFGRWAGDVQSRALHFIRLLDTLEVDAVFPLFGKGGGHDVISAVVETGFVPKRPIVLVGGFSHHTDWALFAQSQQGKGYFSHVLNVTQAAYWKILPDANVNNLRALLSDAGSVQYQGLSQLNDVPIGPSGVRGPLSGGNMGAILLSAHKPWMPDLGGTIVLCEDYDKHPHDFHRGFIALSDMAVAQGARAIFVASMLPLKKPAHAKLDKAARKLAIAADRAEIMGTVVEVASRLPIPVFHREGLFGHGAMNLPLGIGGDTRIRMAADGKATLENILRASHTDGVWS